jgi:hypothetical protein
MSGTATWGILLVLCAGCDLCREDVVREARASDGRVARVAYRNCGATTGFATAVMLIGTLRNTDLIVVRGKWPLPVAWEADGDLRVDLPAGLAAADVFIKKQSKQTIKVSRGDANDVR